MNPIHDVTAAVSESTGLAAIDLPPLFDSIDPEVVVSFVESADDDATLEFEYCDNVVTVKGDGQVETEPITAATPPTF